MKKSLLLIALTALVAACSVDPQAAHERRVKLIQQIFPNQADQKGLFLVFPIEVYGYYATLDIIYFPDEVSESTVKKRVGKYCAQFKNRGATGQSYPRDPSKPVTVTIADGTTRPAQEIWLSCVEKK
jgi:hypothetical protein